MDPTTSKVALAALMHDIGKFADQSVLGVDDHFIENNEALYCPANKNRKGSYTHRHALLTAAFIEKKQDVLPPELSQTGWGIGDSFINLAGMHHKPESPLQWIITVADWLSSGLDREKLPLDEQIGSWREYRKIRLWPIFEHLGSTGTNTPTNWRYPLRVLDASSIFPDKKEVVEPKDNNEALEGYRGLFGEFCGSIGHLDRSRIDLWTEFFDSLLMLYTANVPSARGGDVIPDVSLYDHSRTTAAIAAALYLFHHETDSLEERDIKDGTQKKFLFVSGDFYGIQDFIFSAHGDTRKHRSKLLRGRSFSVSLYTELAADMICRRIGLPSTSIIINAGGKFTIVAPNTESARQAVADVEKEINVWLIDTSYGLNSIGLTLLEAAPADLARDNFHDLWNRLMKKVGAKKFARIDLDQYGGIRQFGRPGQISICNLCGRRPASETAGHAAFVGGDGHEEVCETCRDHIFLGANLVKRDKIAVSTVK